MNFLACEFIAQFVSKRMTRNDSSKQNSNIMYVLVVIKMRTVFELRKRLNMKDKVDG